MESGIGLHLVGHLQDVQVKETLLRTVTALGSLGYHIPGKKIVISVKAEDGGRISEGAAGLDLPVAVALLAVSGVPIARKHLEEYAMVGELGLDGSVRRVRYAYEMALAAPHRIIVPTQEASSFCERPGITGCHKVYVAGNVTDVTHIFRDPEMFDIDNVQLR